VSSSEILNKNSPLLSQVQSEGFAAQVAKSNTTDPPAEAAAGDAVSKRAEGSHVTRYFVGVAGPPSYCGASNITPSSVSLTALRSAFVGPDDSTATDAARGSTVPTRSIVEDALRVVPA
jgi:hypothetical protein